MKRLSALGARTLNVLPFLGIVVGMAAGGVSLAAQSLAWTLSASGTAVTINGIYDLPNPGNVQRSILNNPNIDGIAIRIVGTSLKRRMVRSIGRRSTR